MCNARGLLLTIGAVLNILVFISLPILDGQKMDILNFIMVYTGRIDFAVPINGTLNVVFPFYNLSTIYVSLAASLLIYGRFGLFFRPDRQLVRTHRS